VTQSGIGSRPQGILGDYLRARRRTLGLSQPDVATRCGLSESRLQQLELGSFVRLPKPEVLTRLAQVLLIPLGELLALAGYGEEVAE
jgi:transcriptional regulator with XRE-family HTH domain